MKLFLTIVLSSLENGLIKLCDFGFARHIASSTEIYTDYVATRWYRSPELLVGDPRYGKPVDVWSLGTLAYEVLTCKPLFPGESDLDQLYLIINSLGDLPDSMKLCFQQNHFYMNAKFPRIKNFNPLQNRLKKYSNNLVKFIIDALVIDPHKRSTAADLLCHDLFTANSWLDEFGAKLKNIVAIYEANISKSLAAKNKLAKKSSGQQATTNAGSNSKLASQRQLDKQSEINRINEINKQIEIAKLKEISKFIIQNETANTRLPKIDASADNASHSTGLKQHVNGNISRQATSPANVNINTNSTTTTNTRDSSSRHLSNAEKLKQHSSSVDLPAEASLRSNSILSVGFTRASNDLQSNSLTNTNKLNSNSSFFSSSNVFILEETYKLNNGAVNNGLKNSLKRTGEQKSMSKIESGLNLPQVKQIECRSFSFACNYFKEF